MMFAKLLQQKLNDWRPTIEDQHLDILEAGQTWKAHIQADCVDRIGLRLWELKLEPIESVEGRANLKAWAERLTQRVTGLMEPLRLIELDTLQGTVQLRSETQKNLEGEIAYYELMLQGNGGSTVKRYRSRASEQGKRTQISFSLTHEVFGMLVNDLTTL